jgi:hypothetical protein
VADAPGNIGDGTKDEAVLSLTVPLSKFGVQAAQVKGQVTWRDSEVIDPTTLRPREISALHPLDWELNFTQDVPAWSATWGVIVAGGVRESLYRLTEIETKKQDTRLDLYLDWKPRKGLVVHLELQNPTSRGVTRVREVYAGPRNLAALAYTDVRDLDFNRMFFIRVRKSFG